MGLGVEEGAGVLFWREFWFGEGWKWHFRSVIVFFPLIKGGSLAVMIVCRSVLGTQQWRLGFNACVVKVGLKIA